MDFDPVLNVPLRSLGDRTSIVGLPEIGQRKHYVIGVKRGEEPSLQQSHGNLLLDINYDIQFM